MLNLYILHQGKVTHQPKTRLMINTRKCLIFSSILLFLSSHGSPHPGMAAGKGRPERSKKMEEIK